MRRFRAVSRGASTAGIVEPEYIGGPFDGERYDARLPVLHSIVLPSGGVYRLAFDGRGRGRDRFVFVHEPPAEPPTFSVESFTIRAE